MAGVSWVFGANHKAQLGMEESLMEEIGLSLHPSMMVWKS